MEVSKEKKTAAKKSAAGKTKAREGAKLEKPAQKAAATKTGNSIPVTKNTKAVKNTKAAHVPVRATKDKPARRPKLKFDPELVARMKKIIAQYTEHIEALEQITHDTGSNFIQELNIDSVDVVEIVIDTEKEFDIVIEDDEIKQLKTFELLYKLVAGKIAAKAD